LRGFAYLAKGKLEEAIADMEQAMQLHPMGKGTVCQFNLALAYQLSGNEQSAIRVLSDILASNSHNCDAYYQMGVVYESFQDGAAARRQWLRAVDCREAAVRSQANDADDYLEIAIARTRLGDAARAQAAELKALSIDPSLYFDTARLRSVQGRTDEALTLLERGEKNGLHDFAWVKLNPDLQSLSAQPRFMALLQRNLKGL
jgi:tetratricopeptide (TPR) repeat protein